MATPARTSTRGYHRFADGIDPLNIDDTDDRQRPVHTLLLGTGIPTAEHPCNLGALPTEGFRSTRRP